MSAIQSKTTEPARFACNPLFSDAYRDCILTAVNLGRDTDTVAAVAGGLAGICYSGEKGIPAQWIEKLQPGFKDYICLEKS